MKNFEEKLERLEQLGNDIKKNDVTLEDALKYFEEGITLARGMEKELDKIEGKIQILMNQPDPAVSSSKPELDLFSELSE
ncbi:exodeoxyribonuclease VII small subunit [Treponema brennaborense]|uniref:Exodeoxyribonuclease 7 small subunit n=1 Tax=Treponema brennaborense (strain DSM 12168 / CIP 105900 / DD5/3) TaxID=906968 RepID=F4LIN8_TREBD|nr:exodeoxyribonuclease VII small subunit [Treponema brennaborense]AEE17263.1 Exodeoxyribonuclease 7 small subunit [Treponema brennaborense DSM 12168]